MDSAKIAFVAADGASNELNSVVDGSLAPPSVLIGFSGLQNGLHASVLWALSS